MIKRKTGIGSLLLAGILTVGCSFASMAATKTAETRTPISSVTVHVTSYIEAGDESGSIQVDSGSSQYSVGNTEFSSLPSDGWKVGDTPKVKVYLHARDGYYFDKNVTKKNITVSGATLSSPKKDNNDETLILTLTLDKVGGSLEDPDTAEWVGYPIGKATWGKVEGAKAYELKLYIGDQPIYSVEKCVGTMYDFYPYMTQAGTYRFRVRAVPVDTEEAKYMTPSDWIYSDDMDLSSDETVGAKYNDGSSATNKVKNPSDIGWNESRDGWRYRLTSGDYLTNSWYQIAGKWYYFGYDGYMLVGWQQIGGNTYYLSNNGDMQTGWLQYEREWYFMNPSGGAMMTGWNLSAGKWYYMDPANGKLKTGWLLHNNNWYYLDPNNGGAMARNMSVDSYYVDENGVWVH